MADTNRRNRSLPRRQTGLALVTIMLVVALATTTAAYMSLDQEVWIRQAQTLNDRAQAEAVRTGAINWAIQVLTDDGKDNDSDDEGEDWAKSLPPLEAEGGFVVGRIKDAQARFNLNNLISGNQPSTANIGIFRRILQAKELDGGLADALVDWLDADSIVGPNGAEDLEYLSVSPPRAPYRTANQALQSVDELRLVQGYTGEIVDKLRPLVTVLPKSTTINLNTADKDVLRALFPNIPDAAIDQLLKGKPYDSTAKAIQRLKQGAPNANITATETVGVQSSYFEAHIDTQFGRFLRSSVTLIERPAGGATATPLWRSQQWVNTAEDKQAADNEQEES